MRQANHVVQRVLALIQSRRNRRLETVLGSALLLASLGFLAVTVAQGWTQLRPHLSKISLLPLALAQLCAIAALGLGAVMWGLIQSAVGLGLTWRESVIIHLVSAVTKYAPGYGWQYLSKAYLTKKKGSSTKSVGYAILTEFVLLITGGVLVAAAWRLSAGEGASLLGALPPWSWMLASGIALSVSVGWSLVTPHLAWTAGDRPDARARLLALALGVGGIGWTLFAAATWLVSRSIYPVDATTFPQHVVALVASVILGILVIVVPGGLGVREASLALLLESALPFSLGVVVAVVLRLSIVLWELVGFLLALRLRRSEQAGASGSDRTVF